MRNYDFKTKIRYVIYPQDIIFLLKLLLLLIIKIDKNYLFFICVAYYSLFLMNIMYFLFTNSALR